MDRMLRADKCCNFEDFTSLLQSLIKSTMPDVTFVEAYPSGTDSQEINPPLITYKVKRRSPFNNEIKPRIREQFQTEDDSVTTWGQRFDYVVEFIIYGETNESANKVMNQFEDLITIYKGDLKRNGVQEMFFLEQREDSSANRWRTNLAQRTLYYHVRLEKVTAVTAPKLKLITVRVNNQLVFKVPN